MKRLVAAVAVLGMLAAGLAWADRAHTLKQIAYTGSDTVIDSIPAESGFRLVIDGISTWVDNGAGAGTLEIEFRTSRSWTLLHSYQRALGAAEISSATVAPAFIVFPADSGLLFVVRAASTDSIAGQIIYHFERTN